MGWEGEYEVIYADPPWDYFGWESHPDPGKRSISADYHYPTMSLTDICDMDIPSTRNAVLFLWVPSLLIPDGIQVMKSWNFVYKSSLIREKTNSTFLGSYFKLCHELLFLGVKGCGMTPNPNSRPLSIFRYRRQEHSGKPDLVYSLIERMYPNIRKLELFARERREGWDVWGNEVPTSTQMLLTSFTN